MKKEKDIKFLMFLFVLASFSGWIIEFMFTSVKYSYLQFPGCFYGPYLPIYGFGGVLLVLLCKSNNKIFEFIKIIVFLSLIEYIASFIIELTTGIMWWDYSDFAYNLNGRVCLRYSLYWAVLGLLYLNYVHKYTIKFYNYVKSKNYILYFNIVFYIIACDMLITIIRDLIT